MPSSVVSSMNYNTETHTLRVYYVSGSVYDYVNVPLKIYEDMKNSASKGIFLNRVIKNHFGFRKIK